MNSAKLILSERKNRFFNKRTSAKNSPKALQRIRLFARMLTPAKMSPSNEMTTNKKKIIISVKSRLLRHIEAERACGEVPCVHQLPLPDQSRASLSPKHFNEAIKSPATKRKGAAWKKIAIRSSVRRNSEASGIKLISITKQRLSKELWAASEGGDLEKIENLLYCYITT